MEWEVFVLTVSTNKCRSLDIFMESLSRNGYKNVFILELGCKWQCWSWRTKKYLQAVKDLNKPNRLFCLVDSTDLFFVKGERELIDKYNKITKGKNKVVISGERNPNFIVGHAIKADIIEKDGVLYTSPYCNPCAGSIVGPGAELIKMLELNKDHLDDQDGLAYLILEGKIDVIIDMKNEITGTIATLDWNLNYSEYTYWDNNLTNIITGTSPVIFHFPGKFPYHYNTFLKRVYPDLEGKTYTDYVINVIQREAFMYIILALILILIFLFQSKRLI